jgi:hypothetical protein
MKWIIDYIIGTIESIGTFSPGGAVDVEYFVITFREYKTIYFKVHSDTAMKYKIYKWSTPGAFNQQKLDSLKGRRAAVRVRPEKPGNNYWYIVDEFELLE